MRRSIAGWLILGGVALVWFAWADLWFALVRSIGEQDRGDRVESVVTFIVDPVLILLTAASLIRYRRFWWQGTALVVLMMSVTFGPIALS